ncbi:hypothetical protein FRC02_002076 [Tulasnella sp. 418]|nr:hypothetical protein FRC02_002076 [Tulasnella sp. 418]
MNPYIRPINGNLPLAASLYEDESLITSQDGVGLYDGKDKLPEQQVGTTHVTSHRLIYIDLVNPRHQSIALNLSNVRQTEYYAGFLKSSSKVTLVLGPSSTSAADDDEENQGDTESSRGPAWFTEAWICPVCSYSNPPSANEGPPVCVLCGVTRDPEMASRGSSKPTASIAIPPASSSRSLAAVESLSALGTSKSLPNVVGVEGSQDVPPGGSEGLACPTCTFLNHPSMKLCEMCSTPLRSKPRASLQPPQLTVSQRSAPASRAATPGPDAHNAVMKISFRKGGDKPFYASLKKTLMEKAWERKVVGPSTISNQVMGPSSGIHGIMESVASSARAEGENISSSLKDLEALMAKAKDMVQLAESLNTKLVAQEEAQAKQRLLPGSGSASPVTTIESEEAKFIRSSMARLGLTTMAITKDMVKDEEQYHEELAKELAGVLLGVGVAASKTGSDGSKGGMGLMKLHHGIIGLDEVWCAWNRARGVALVPPSSLMTVIPLLPQYTNPPIQLRTFKSGLRVLHAAQYTHQAFTSRFLQSVQSDGPKNSIEVARSENLSVGLVEQMISEVEDDGLILRDEVSGGYEPISWWYNVLKGMSYDGTQ